MTVSAKDWVDKGVTVGLSHAAFALWVQLTSVAFYSPLPDGASVWALLAMLPIAQPSAWAAALVVMFLGVLLRLRRAGRLVYFVVVTALNLALVFDQQVFGRFYEHFSPALLDPGIGTQAFFIVVLGGVDGAALASFVGLAPVTFYIYRVLWRDDVPRVLGFVEHVAAGLRRPLFHLTVVALVAVNVLAGLWLPLYQVNEHPVFMPFYRALTERATPWNQPSPVNIRSLRYGSAPADADPLSVYLRDPPLALVGAPPRRIVWVETGGLNIPSDLFTELASQHAGFNRLLAGGIVFEKFLYHGASSGLAARAGEVLPGYRTANFQLRDSAPDAVACVERDAAVDRLDAWWTEQVSLAENTLAYLDISSAGACGEVHDTAFFAALIGAVEARNRQVGDADQTVIMVSGHYAESTVADDFPLGLTQLNGFMVMSFPDRLGTLLTTPRQAGEADLLHTLAIMAGTTLAAGRDMLAPHWPQQLLYFAHGEPNLRGWSVIDGEWQYSATVWGTQQTLFHLQQDPAQQHDLSDHFPNRLRYYDRLMGAWYARQGYRRVPPGNEFVDYQGQWWRPAFLNIPGPKTLRMGYVGTIDGLGGFRWNTRFNPHEPVLVFVRMLPVTEPIELSFEWVTPAQERGQYGLTARPGWTYSYVIPGFGLPMAEGRWGLFVKDARDGRVLLAEEFRVDKNVALRAELALTLPQLRDMKVGYFSGRGAMPEQDFVIQPLLGHDQSPVMAMEWVAPQHMSYLMYRWKSPQGLVYAGEHGVRPEWTKTWIIMDPSIERVAGRWVAQIMDGDRIIAERMFELTDAGSRQ